MAVITEEQLSLYTSLFKGREDIYARRWEKAGKSGYAPAYKFDCNGYLILISYFKRKYLDNQKTL